jgi:molybdopterin-guanine dinucleotide biosynthesis protein A
MYRLVGRRSELLSSKRKPGQSSANPAREVWHFMQEIEGFILVGGASSRMGANKALLSVGGRNFVERIHAALNSIARETRLVGAEVRHDAWPILPVIPDARVKWGALGGLYTALLACQTEWAAIVACDLPFVTGELFVRLASLRENFFDAVVPVQRDGRWQPLCALYRVETCRPSVEALINAGERRPRALLETVETRMVAFDELYYLDGADHFFLNVNTPQDYATAREKEIKRSAL